MFIKVTNAVLGRRGDPLILNINMINSVFENHVEGGSLSTMIYHSDNLNWAVEESLEKVHALINEAIARKVG